jgi:hypothetical protein
MADIPLTCARCSTAITADELGEGLAVRVDGDLVCSMCVDTLPGEAQVQINQMRAMRGLTVTTYQVANPRLPRVQLYSFTNAANITGHRRKLATDGFFDAPLLPPPQEREKPEPPPTQPRTARHAKGAPDRRPMIIAAAATVLVLGGTATVLSVMAANRAAGAKPQAMVGGTIDPTPPQPEPARPTKTRFDYSVDPLRGFVQASQDKDCPDFVRQAITQELVRKRAQQLDDAETALGDRRLDDANSLANALTLPDDLAFRDLRAREQNLRTRLLNSRTLTSVTPPPTVPVPPTASPAPQPPAPVAPAAPVADNALRLSAETANIAGTKLQLENKGGRRSLGFWTDPTETPTWKATFAKAGTYRVDAVVGISGTSFLAVDIAGQMVSARTPDTGGYGNFRSMVVGTVAISAPGEQLVRVRPLDPATWQPVNIAELTLTPTADPVTAVPIPPTPPPAAPVPANAGAAKSVVWKPQFLPTGAKDAGRPLPLDGSVFIPSGWPGGTDDFYRSGKGGAKKRHLLALDLGGLDASEGGLVLLLHPMRVDRKQVTATLSDAAGKSVTLPPVAFTANDWTVATFATKGIGLNAAALRQLTLEDDASQESLPEDGGFVLVRMAVTTQKDASAADLGLRAAALLRDDNRLKNLPRLLEAVGRFRKRPWQKNTDLGKLRVLVSAPFSRDWRLETRSFLDPLVPKLPNPLFHDLAFQDGWLDTMTKGGNAALDPAQHHLAVLLTGGEELSTAPSAAQALDGFWKKRLDQLINAGVVPVVVLGPNRQSGDRRNEAEKLWPELAEFIAKRQLGIPVIDLRAARTLPTGELGGNDATLAGQLLADGLNEFFYALRRSGGAKP